MKRLKIFVLLCLWLNEALGDNEEIIASLNSLQSNIEALTHKVEVQSLKLDKTVLLVENMEKVKEITKISRMY